MSDDASWVEQLQEKPGSRSDTIREALTDLTAVCGSPESSWVDLTNEPSVLVYVLARGVLHRLSGERDPIWDHSKPDEETKCECEYLGAAITEDSTYSLSVTRATGLNGVVRVSRAWTFDRLGRIGSLQITYPPPPGSGFIQGRDPPAPFARALAAEIARQTGGD